MDTIEQKPFSPHGVDLFGDPIIPESKSPIVRKFGVSPFSILDARSGEWQDQKRAWGEVGIESELGRDDGLTYAIPTQSYSKENMSEEYYGKEAQKLNTSIFDPVLCELSYKWYSNHDHQVVDPFAGGSARGVIAGLMGRKYWGGELRKEQVEANRKQAADLCPEAVVNYVSGDSKVTLDDAPEADFIFSCPPYGDLEKYSDDPDDLSNMEFHTFIAAYKHIIFKACQRLKENRFACFVVGDFRDKKGHYRNFVSETIQGFLNAGLELYNEKILVTAIGSGSMRLNRQFDASRKVVKTHQNVLVFVKGDWKKAAEAVEGGLE